MKSIVFILSLLIVALSWCTLPWKQDNTPVTTQTQIIEQRIFILWDSLSAGYQLAYEDSYPAQLEQLLQNQWYAIKVINGGESGDTSAWLKSRIDRITADAQSGDLALIVIGGNDGLQWLSTEDLKTNITETILLLQSRGITTILWWMQIPTNLWETYRSNFNAVYPAVARETNSLLIPFILSWVAGIPELNLYDGIHPNATGQTIIAKMVFDIISPLLQ